MRLHLGAFHGRTVGLVVSFASLLHYFLSCFLYMNNLLNPFLKVKIIITVMLYAMNNRNKSFKIGPFVLFFVLPIFSRNFSRIHTIRKITHSQPSSSSSSSICCCCCSRSSISGFLVQRLLTLLCVGFCFFLFFFSAAHR